MYWKEGWRQERHEFSVKISHPYNLSILLEVQTGGKNMIFLLYNKFKQRGIDALGLGDMGDIFQVESFHREHKVDMWLIHEQDQVESFRVDARKLTEVLVSCPRSAWAGSWGTVSWPESKIIGKNDVVKKRMMPHTMVGKDPSLPYMSTSPSALSSSI